MITIRPGSHVHTLLTILSFVGEYPVTALGLLGSVRSYKDLIHKLTMPQEFRFPDSEERFICRLLTVSGKGKCKTIRLHKSALPLLKHWDEDAYDNYMYEFDDHTFSGNSRHVERNHLVAETAVMCMKAGIEANPLYTPEVMEDEVRRLRLTEPCFYFARELKRVNDYELNKIRFGFTKDGYFCMRFPRLIPGMNGRSMLYLRKSLAPRLEKFWNYRGSLNKDKHIIIFLHVYPYCHPGWERHVPADGEVDFVLGLVLKNVCHAYYASDFKHYCSIS